MEEEFNRCAREMSPLVSDTCLQEMISIFNEVIGSKRRSSSIRSFQELVVLLVKRDCIDPFDKSTWKRLDDECRHITGRPFFVQPASAAAAPAHQPEEGSAPVYQEPTSALPEAVVNYLAIRINYSWRNFARGLQLSQCDIDKIESAHGTNRSECVKQVLCTYERIMPWTSKNGNALEDIYGALQLLQEDYLVDEFVRLTRMQRR